MGGPSAETDKSEVPLHCGMVRILTVSKDTKNMPNFKKPSIGNDDIPMQAIYSCARRKTTYKL